MKPSLPPSLTCFLPLSSPQAYGPACPWLQETFNLETELAPFVGSFLERQRAAAANEQAELWLSEGQRLLYGGTSAADAIVSSGTATSAGSRSAGSSAVDNTWIVKPWNLARSMDTNVSRHLSQIVRLVETGPKICQKYIQRPALFQGRKFDLRILVMLKRLRPLEAYVADMFWVSGSAACGACLFRWKKKWQGCALVLLQVHGAETRRGTSWHCQARRCSYSLTSHPGCLIVHLQSRKNQCLDATCLSVGCKIDGPPL